jgi:hypothetical protein
MNKVLIVAIGALALAGCTVREQQLATAGVAGAVIGTALSQPRSDPYYVQPHPYPQPRPYYVHPQHRPHYARDPNYVVIPPYRPRCFMTWDRTPYGMVQRQVCNRY